MLVCACMDFTMCTWKGQQLFNYIYIPLLQVLTRRQQLQMVKDIEAAKNEAKESKGRGAARGGGRGRGRGRGNPKTKAKAKTQPQEQQQEIDESETGMEVEVKNLPSSSSRKRGDQTPERRKLFTSCSPSKLMETQVDEAVVQSSPPVKRTPKRARHTAKAKAKAKVSKETEPAKAEQPEATPEALSAAPSAEAGKGSGKGSEGMEMEEAKKEKKPRALSKKQETWALTFLQDAKNDEEDPATWEHALKMFDATKCEERNCVPKMTYWAFSMYWGARRVGLLQKVCGGGSKHVLSFGGGHCKHIAIPTEATRLFVSWLNQTSWFTYDICNRVCNCNLTRERLWQKLTLGESMRDEHMRFFYVSCILLVMHVYMQLIHFNLAKTMKNMQKSKHVR